MAPSQTENGETYTAFMGIRGRNGYDDPFMVAEDQCCEALNVDWYGAALGRRRGGSVPIALTGGTAFTNQIYFMGRNVPGFDQGAAELYAADGANPALLKKLTGGTAWANVTVADSIDNLAAVNAEMQGVSFNGKYFLAYKHAGINRLHVVDPVAKGVMSAGEVRRVGLAVSATPTAADTGGGATLGIRYYKVRWIAQVSGATVLAGELSPSLSFTPTVATARVTRPALLGEAETHWELFISNDNANFFSLAVVAAATTTYDDTSNPANASTAGKAAPLSGFHLPPPSARFIVAGSSRLIMGGAFETSGGEVVPSDKNLWWTASPGGDVGDDERIIVSTTINNFATLDSAVTGISAPIVNPGSLQETFFAFTFDGQFRFTSTGDVTNAYTQVKIAGGQGCISHKTIIVAHDDAGYPTTYWLSRRGVERSGLQGNQFCSADVQDIWDRVNLNAQFFHGQYHSDIHQIWWYVALDGNGSANCKIVFDTWLGRVIDVFRLGAVRGGWSQHTGESTKAICSVMFSDTIGAIMSVKLKPYISYQVSQGIWKCDVGTALDDNGTGWQSYVESKPLAPWGLGRMGGFTQEPHVIWTGPPLFTTPLMITAIIDEGTSGEPDPRTSSVSYLFGGGAVTRAFGQFSTGLCSRARTVRIRVGDTAVSTTTPQWRISAVIIPSGAQGYQ